MKGISNEDLYKLMSRISIVEAAALTAGIEPNRIYADDHLGNTFYIYQSLRTDPHNANMVYVTTLNALIRAIQHSDLEAFVAIDSHSTDTYLSEQLIEGNLISRAEYIRKIDPMNTTVDREDLKKWFLKHGVKPECFFPKNDIEPYLNKLHHCYSPKLAALVSSWKQVVSSGVPIGLTAKQAIIEYLEQNGAAFTKDGKQLTGKIDELAAVANWDTVGGKSKHLGDLIGVDPEVFMDCEVTNNKCTVRDDLMVNLDEVRATFEKVRDSSFFNDDSELPF